MASPDAQIVWKYLVPISHATHGLMAGTHWQANIAVCGTNVDPNDPERYWSGDSEQEVDHAAALPRCRRCERTIEKLL